MWRPRIGQGRGDLDHLRVVAGSLAWHSFRSRAPSRCLREGGRLQSACDECMLALHK